MTALARVSKVAGGVVLLAFLAVPGCGLDEGTTDPVSTATGALVRTGNDWPLSGGTHVIPVCWETGLDPEDGSGQEVNPHTRPDWAQLSATVRDAMRNSWGRVANIEFVWFLDCPSNTSSGNGGYIAINMAGGNNAPGGATLTGYQGPNAWTRMRLDTDNPTDPNLDPWLDFAGQVMHETGHALGFDHEDDRADNPHNTGCPVADGNTVGNPGPYYGTSFDLHSIMNYSYDQGPSYCQLPRPYRLSEWDIIGVQNRYGRRTAGELVAGTGSCVDIPQPYTRDEALQIYQCNKGANQTWRFTPSGSFGKIFNPTQAAYVESRSGTGPGQTVKVGPNLSSGMVQTWNTSGYQIRGIGDMCLDIPSAQIFTGQVVQIYGCHDGANQRWKAFNDQTIRPISDTGYCLDVPNGSAVPQNILQLAPCNGAASQKFTFQDNGEIHYQSLCVDVRTGFPTPGNVIQLYTCSANHLALNQLWHLNTNLIVSNTTSLCMEAQGGSTLNHTAVVQNICNGSPSQSWDYYFKTFTGF